MPRKPWRTFNRPYFDSASQKWIVEEVGRTPIRHSFDKQDEAHAAYIQLLKQVLSSR